MVMFEFKILQNQMEQQHLLEFIEEIMVQLKTNQVL